MTILEPDAFLTQLTRILERSRTSGTIYVTMKRCALGLPMYECTPVALHKLSSATYSADVPPDAKDGRGESTSEPRCLVRAVGAKHKISAMVSSKDYRRFMQSYGNILKVSLDSLKKREKKKTIDKKLINKAGSAKAS